MIWAKPPVGDSRGEHLPAPVPLQGRELPRKAQRKKGFGSIGWELIRLEVYLASCQIALQLERASAIPREPGDTSFTSGCRVRGPLPG